MKTILNLALATTLLAGLSTFASAQEAAPAQTQTGQVNPDAPAVEGDDQGGFWGKHGGKHGGGHHGEKHGGGKHGGKHGKRGHGAMNIDANGDSVISDTEAATLAGYAFNHLDREGNDAISETEFTASGKHHRGWSSWFGTETAEDAAVSKLRKEKFVMLDADKNAVVDKAEFMTDFKTRFMTADADKDGKVTVWEFQMQK